MCVVSSEASSAQIPGFVRSLKTWKSHGNSKCKFQALEKLWKTIFFPKFWKSHGNITKVASNIIYMLSDRQNNNTIMILNTVSYSNET